MAAVLSPFAVYLAEGLTTYFTPDEYLTSADLLEEQFGRKELHPCSDAGPDAPLWNPEVGQGTRFSN